MDLTGLERRLKTLADKVRKLSARLDRLERQHRRAGLVLTDYPTGTQEFALTWGKPMPDDTYHVTVTLARPAAAITAMSAALKLNSKTVDGCVVIVTSTAAATIPLATLDVLATG